MVAVRKAVLIVAIALGTSACVDRVLHDHACHDGRVDANELCLDGERIAITVPFSPLSVRVDDFDGDGDSDLLVLGVDPAGAVRGALVPGDGNGAFAAPVDAGVYGCSAYPVPGRFDADGPADLLVDDCDDSMLGFFGSTSGVFAGPMRIEVGALTRTSGIVDLDRDGAGDVVVLGDPGDGSSVLNAVRAQGNGAFDPPVSLAIGTPAAVGFSIADVDGDDRLDAALSIDGGASSPALALGRADALGFSAPAPWTAIAASRGVALADLDADDVAEAVALHSAAPELGVYRRKHGEYQLVATTDLSGHADALLQMGHLDGDDNVDLATYGNGSTSVELWLADDDLSWTPTDSIDIGAPVQQLVLADLDDDGAADLIAGTFDAGEIRVVLARP